MFSMRCRGLCDDSSDQVVGEQMRPDFLANHVGSLASQHVHVHHGFEAAKIDLSVPIIIPPKITL